MAWPTSGVSVAAYDKTAYTFGRSVDDKLWPALMARSPLLSAIPRFPVDHTKFEWETQNEPTRTFTADGTSNTTIDVSGATSNKYICFSSVVGLQEGDLIRNISRATPVGTYGADEIMQVVGITSNTAEVLRDYQYRNTGTGYASHDDGDVFEVVGTAREEGSSPDENRYKDVTLVENYTQIFDYYLAVTGSQFASKRLVAGDTLAAQTALGHKKLANELEKTFLYGALAQGANAGSDSYVRTSKGFQQFVQVASGNVDYSTKVVTATALDALFEDILTDGTDPMDKFIIVTHPSQARVISHFGEDVVRTTQENTAWGREIKTFQSDLGVQADILWTLNCSPSDLFIIDLNKVGIAEFRAWKQAEWTYDSDGVDAWRQRTLGELGFKVVDALYSHAALGYLTWV
jgi:hypothetical protein